MKKTKVSTGLLSLRMYNLYDRIYFACSDEYKKTRNKIKMSEWIRRACRKELERENKKEIKNDENKSF